MHAWSAVHESSFRRWSAAAAAAAAGGGDGGGHGNDGMTKVMMVMLVRFCFGLSANKAQHPVISQLRNHEIEVGSE